MSSIYHNEEDKFASSSSNATTFWIFSQRLESLNIERGQWQRPKNEGHYCVFGRKAQNLAVIDPNFQIGTGCLRGGGV
ncbi:hypothetical protein SCA6_009225 [Theobroma cacao]